MKNLKEGYVLDYISNQQVKATPEEVEAVQPFSKQLVEDYNYPKKNIRTRPQYRIKQRPSGNKDFPLDIVVFKGEEHSYDNEYILVECKRKNKQDGRQQLENYLLFSKAQLGVWFNGEERLFLRKIEKLDGLIIFEEIPNIPEYQQRVEDIGKFKRNDLKPTHNLKSIFKAIRNYLAGNVVGATRDEILAQQLINLIFCKIYDERFTEKDSILTFRAGLDENSEDVRERILKLFNQVKRKYKEVFDDRDNLELDANSIAYVVGELQRYCLIDAERDIVADAFETFIGHALKGGQGQFFTPRNIIKMIVEILDPNDEDLIIDPACGTGGFLIESLRYIWRNLENEGKKLDWSRENLQEEKMEVALNKIRGIDKDYFLAKVAKAYMAIMGDGKSGIFNEDSLDQVSNWGSNTKTKVHLDSFSVLMTNPPFGSKIKVSGEKKLKQYQLGYKWILNSNEENKNHEFAKGRLKDKEAPQILFIERSLQLLKNYGRMGIVLPDGIFGNETTAYIRNWLITTTRVVAIIDVPIETFMPNTGTKTSVLIVQKLELSQIPKDYPIFMAVADFCGHDRRGKEIKEDDIANIPSEFKKWCIKNKFSFQKESD